MELRQTANVLVSDLLQAWLVSLQPTVRPTSFSVYQSEVQNHILPTLGQLPLKELSASSGEALTAELTAKGLSLRTAKDVAGKLGQALRWGMDQGYEVPILKENKLERDPQSVRVLTREEETRLGASLTGGSDALINAILLTWKAGLSIGEACALSCEDVDGKKKTITVHRLCQRTSGGLSYSDEQPRTVPLPDELRRGKGVSKSGFFLQSARGAGTEPRLCQLWLKRHLKSASLPEDIGFSTLRNSYIRGLMESGEDFIRVSQLSGCRDLNDLWRKFGMFYPAYKN